MIFENCPSILQRNRLLAAGVVALGWAVSVGALSGCDSVAVSGETGAVLHAEERKQAVMIYGLLSRISIYSDRLPPLETTWSIGDVTEPLGDRFTFYTPPTIAATLIEQEKKPLEEEGKIVPTVYVDSIAPELSVIQITEFRRVTLEEVPGEVTGTWREFRRALEQTSSEPVTLIDLRNNPGGSVAICLGMADELVPEGKGLMEIEDRSAPWNGRPLMTTQPATAGGLGEQRRFVFLANRWSASCSELFLAAALGTRGDFFVGEKTYGKGIGQSLWVLPNGGMMRITSMMFRGPDGRYWNGSGIVPDIEVEGRTEQLTRAVELALELKDNSLRAAPPAKVQSGLDGRLGARTSRAGTPIGVVAEAEPLPAEFITEAEEIGERESK